MRKSGEWWDKSWVPVVGCDMSLPCAKRCWARPFANRLKSNPSPKVAAKYRGITDAAGQRSGVVRLDERELERPLSWRKPCVVAVSLMGDLFHEALPDAAIDRVYAVMALCPQHRFAVLTKRSRRRWEYLGNHPLARILELCRDAINITRPDLLKQLRGTWVNDQDPLPWPLPNVIEMVSCEDQATLDERVPWLLKTPAAMRGLHLEPMIGPVDIRRYLPSCEECGDQPKLYLQDGECVHAYEWTRSLNWVILGGESGPGARPMHPEDVRRVRDQCQAAGVAFWFKGWGEWLPVTGYGANLNNPRYRFDDKGQAYLPVGKKRAGRLLDGRTWDGFPEVKPGT